METTTAVPVVFSKLPWGEWPLVEAKVHESSADMKETVARWKGGPCSIRTFDRRVRCGGAGIRVFIAVARIKPAGLYSAWVISSGGKPRPCFSSFYRTGTKTEVIEKIRSFLAQDPAPHGRRYFVAPATGGEGAEVTP